jgi:DNA invertase Pin-like site-specific DNA recombinase
MRQIITYIRVSTGKQGKSGLGIEAQREAIARFAVAEGTEVLAEFVEVETGKGSDALERRPKLAEALAKARRAKAPVVVANPGHEESSLVNVFSCLIVPASNQAVRCIG